MRFDKKGISAIVATVLIILVTVAAVTIIWVAIIPMISERFGFDDSNVRLSVVTSGGYTVYDLATKQILIQVKRGSDEAELSGIKITLSFNGISYYEIVEPAPELNQQMTYHFNLSGYDGPPTSVSISPIFIEGNKEVEGSTGSEVEVPSGRIVDPPENSPLFSQPCIEGETRETSCGVGICAGNTGTETCTARVWDSDTCNPLDGATAEICDAGELNEDCDAESNEGCACNAGDTEPTNCGTGVCASTGIKTCTLAGVFAGDTCVAGSPTEDPEVSCSDELDNDCNGDVDGDDSSCSSIPVAYIVQEMDLTIGVSTTWDDYMMGNEIMPLENKQLVELCRYGGETTMIYLYDISYNILASTSISGSLNSWTCGSVSPVGLSSGSTYYVVENVPGAEGQWATLGMPQTQGGIQIVRRVYQRSISGTIFNSSHLETLRNIYIVDIGVIPA